MPRSERPDSFQSLPPPARGRLGGGVNGCLFVASSHGFYRHGVGGGLVPNERLITDRTQYKWRGGELVSRARSARSKCQLAQNMQCAVTEVDFPWAQFPPGNWVAPAGSSRSGSGGNNTVGAFDVKGSRGDSAKQQAVI